jgi:hypothetical protein
VAGSPEAGQEDVGRLEVAVDDAAAVGHVGGPGHHLHQPGGLFGRLRGLAGFRRQGAAVHKL